MQDPQPFVSLVDTHTRQNRSGMQYRRHRRRRRTSTVDHQCRAELTEEREGGPFPAGRVVGLTGNAPTGGVVGQVAEVAPLGDDAQGLWPMGMST